MTELTLQEKSTLIQIIKNSRFLPDEWEIAVKPIVIKLQEVNDGNTV